MAVKVVLPLNTRGERSESVLVFESEWCSGLAWKTKEPEFNFWFKGKFFS